MIGLSRHARRAYTSRVQPVPRYPFITPTTLRIAGSILVGRRRDFLTDACRLVAQLQPPPIVDGIVPDLTGSGWLVIANHLHSETFRAWWIALSVTAALQTRLHWIMTGAWVYPDGWQSLTLEPAMHWVLTRLAKVYGFTSMPPMPPRPWEVQARARAVLAAVRFAGANPAASIGLVPEGGDTADGALMRPPPGVGRFISLLTQTRRRILPVGMFELDGRLHLNLGAAFDLDPVSGKDRDQRAAEACMRAIAECIPEGLRGAYG